MDYENMAEDEMWDALDFYQQIKNDKGFNVAYRRQARIEALHLADAIDRNQYVPVTVQPSEVAGLVR